MMRQVELIHDAVASLCDTSGDATFRDLHAENDATMTVCRDSAATLICTAFSQNLRYLASLSVIAS